MCGFVFVKYRYSKNNELQNNFFEKECNNFIRSRGPSYQEIYKSNAMFIYQSTLAIQSDSIKSSNFNHVWSVLNALNALVSMCFIHFALFLSLLFDICIENRQTQNTSKAGLYGFVG